MEKEKEITATPAGEADGEKTYKCEKCGQVKKQSEGNFVLGGSAFCCTDCCGSPDDKKEGASAEQEDDGVCEFC